MKNQSRARLPADVHGVLLYERDGMKRNRFQKWAGVVLSAGILLGCLSGCSGASTQIVPADLAQLSVAPGGTQGKDIGVRIARACSTGDYTVRTANDVSFEDGVNYIRLHRG